MTLAEAKERFGIDAAAVWERVAAGSLKATRGEDGRWNIEETD